MNKPWLQYYPEGVPAEVPELPFASLVDLLEDSFKRFADRPVFKFMGRSITYREMDVASRNFAAYLQAKGLKRGDRVALMMPNVLQYPVAVAGVLRAGMVVVNTNPLYTPRELKHQLTDSGARAIVILENMATTLQKCLPDVPVEHVIVASVGDMLPMLKGTIVNFVLRRVKKMVPAYELPEAERWNHAIRTGAASTFERVAPAADDMASLQYTGGTTGVSKGCILSHRNLVSNVIQSELWHEPAMRNVPAGEQTNTICALPLYHIFGFTVNMMLSMRQGGCNILIINPRDIPAVIKELKAQPFHLFPAVNTLFGAIARHPDARSVDWSSLRISVGGGMAVQGATADLWQQVTGCTICQGYGLSETAPVACCNIVTETQYTGTIGYPVPSTDCRIVDDDGNPLPVGERGELAIKGPQVTAGYWNRPDDTKKSFTKDGYFLTGDIGVMDETGATKIVDRKKDMINVSGFNVYPNEVEDVVTRMPGIVEAAAIGMEDENSGEVVKLFVVTNDSSVTEEAVKAFCRDNLTGYKRPKVVEFRDELPKTNVGKVLRRELRN
ncbi:long-chain acyl-CoA synthetase [Aureimonas altamirensis DSM 21988]|uniref:Long-chain-fatty-acid--CoA ligase n=1 Tax=Aureimonas altamirensis DSM 21988 TaxID=1121026 RepID=A0ABY1IQ19_9HYPH|nr:long-chain-fatty-acid--CoA ligase [Aureimonas altamirensis]SHJ82910.1 long-chain acyl-CoA synthetase [Aureimonas altamirensis DSM 21988]